MTTVLSALSEQNFGNNTQQVEAALKKHEAIAADIEARVLSLALDPYISIIRFTDVKVPRVGPGHPSSPLSIYFLIFSPFHFSLSFIGFTYFLLLSIPSLSTRIVPLRFQAGGRRRRPNLGLVCVLFRTLCFVLYFVLSVFLS